MIAANSSDLSQPHRRGRSLRWPAVVVALLGVHVMGMLFATVVVMQHRGDSAVIPDYYQKAESWDAFRQRQAISEQLGWQIAIQPAEALDTTGHRQVHFLLTDSAAHPIDNAQISVHCFHLSHGDQAAILTASPVGSGDYALALPANYSGFWQFEMTADVAGKQFIQTSTHWIN